jgi:hypothetical protein
MNIALLKGKGKPDRPRARSHLMRRGLFFSNNCSGGIEIIFLTTFWFREQNKRETLISVESGNRGKRLGCFSVRAKRAMGVRDARF